MRLWGKLADLGYYRSREEAIEIRNKIWEWYFGFNWLRIVSSNANKSRIHDVDGVGLYFDRDTKTWVVWPGDRARPIGRFANREEAVSKMIQMVASKRGQEALAVPDFVKRSLINCEACKN